LLKNSENLYGVSFYELEIYQRIMKNFGFLKKKDFMSVVSYNQHKKSFITLVGVVSTSYAIIQLF